MGDLHKCPTCGHMAIVCEDEYKQLEQDLAARDAELAEYAMKYKRAADALDDKHEELARYKAKEEAGQLTAIADVFAKSCLERADAAERKAEEAARDAGRYRWLRGNPCLPFGVTRYRSEPVEYYAGDSLDASIDAAIAAKGEA